MISRYKLALIPWLLLLFIFASCQKDNSYEATLQDAETYQKCAKKLSDAIVYDIFSPPVASRVYAYSNIAAFETLAASEAFGLISLAGQITELTPCPEPIPDVNLHLASIHAFLTVGKALIFTEKNLGDFQDQLYQQLKDQGLSSGVRDASLEYGETVAAHILKWANQDMYKQTRTYPKYTISTEPYAWKPTPPDYMEGIEPHWNKIRTLILDSADQFVPTPPHTLTMDESSPFYAELKEVFDVGNELNDERTEIAKFWDCNPYVSHHKGHAMFATKKITPGGHWMGITAIACRQTNSGFETTVEAFTRTSIALFDAFISCWDEKWRSIVIRPETLINQYMDEDWKPLLQTPPFPEYTSGHSVISRAAAVTLTDFFGDDFYFEDITEEEFGLPMRTFNSFLEASEEAAISRLYGGIHYRMAIENGVAQGHNVGDFVVENLKTTQNNNELMTHR
ncbi:vanadium-dependent haloperoxidase [Marinoscillum sp. MHG1-6]|uniref:vanadium-dependent haloperoxidase n=1 Tax=Marinoscillum sp. MHG1-6 TaxID=2959627 RepID=UPI0021572CFF|nr:vanadium-dependent haloperoxidase [Marinoscillum sp. MHG1-6]